MTVRLTLIAATVALALASPVQASALTARTIGPVAGRGPTPAIAESWSDAPGYTVYRPARLPRARMPLVLWGNGGCRDNGLSASHFLREIASHGYVVIANGSAREESPVLDQLPAADAPPLGSPPRATPDETTVAQYLAAIDWVQTARKGARSRWAGRIDLTRIAAMGHSCGGLQALAAGADPRIATVVAFNSGVYNRMGTGLSGVRITKDDLKKLHTPVAYFIGGPADIAFANAADDVARLSHVPVLGANLPVGHGGTFRLAGGGDWGRAATAWLDWQLKGDAAAAKWFVGRDCRLCTTFGWTITRKQFPEYP